MALIPIKQAGRSLSRNRADAIDNVLTFMFLSENREQWEWMHEQWGQYAKVISAFQKVPLMHFDGADLTMLYDSMLETTSYDRYVVDCFSPEDQKELQRLPGLWDFTFAGYFDGFTDHYAEDIKDRTYLFSMERYRSVPLKEVRGLFPLRASTVIEWSEAHLLNDGSYLSTREYLQFFKGAWHAVGFPVDPGEPIRLDEPGQNGVWIARAFALTREYDWSVHAGFNVKAVPTVCVPTDPIAARNIFKLRDVPPGKSRRDAIRHWVSGHTRVKLDPNYAEIHIWPYLRGAEEFTWNGLYCRIQPSEFDLKKAKQYQMMRNSEQSRRA